MSEARAKRFFAEPLVQFLIIGAAIFAIDFWVSANTQDDTKIVIDDPQLNELISIFVQGQGREPSPTEVDNLIVKWTQNEILFREARKMGLDKGDEMIRSRLVLKMQNVLFNSVLIDAPPEEELKAWFTEYRENYDIPAKFTIEQFYYGPEAQNTIAEAKTLVERMRDLEVPQEYAKQLRRYAKRPKKSLTGLFNEQGLDTLLSSNLNQWQTLVSNKGLHLARITHVEDAQQADFNEVKRQVGKDWMQYSNDTQLMQQTTEIANRYSVDITATKANKYIDDIELRPETAGE